MIIPVVMLEAAVRAEYEADGGRDWDERQGQVSAAYIKRTLAGLAAALGVCEVRAEWSARKLLDESQTRLWLSTPTYFSPGVPLARRFVFTTPAEPVTDTEEST